MTEEQDRAAAHLEKHVLEQTALERERKGHEAQHLSDRTALKTALDAERERLEAHRHAHEAAHAAHEALHENAVDSHVAQHASENRAVMAATVAMDKRLDEMNAFREQLRDQAATFVRRETLDAFIAERRHALEAVGSEIDKRYEELRTLIATEREERRAAEGVRRGVNSSTAVIVAAIGVVGTVLGIIVVVLNLATGTP